MNLENSIYILWQTFWILAAALTIWAFIYDNKEKTINILLIGGIFWILQFLLLWAYSWAIVNCFWFLRTLFAKYHYNDKKLLIFLFFIIGIINYFSYKGPISLLPLLATSIATYALFYAEWIRFRVILIIPSILWLIYSYTVWSIGGTIREIIILILHLKVILLSMTFAYKQEIYKLNYDIFVYLYNTSYSKAYLVWKKFQHFFTSAWNIFSRKKNGNHSKTLFH